jgi:hypothetical protein
MLSSTARGVRPGANDRGRCFSVTRRRKASQTRSRFARDLVGTSHDFRCFRRADAGIFSNLPDPGGRDFPQSVIELRNSG